MMAFLYACAVVFVSWTRLVLIQVGVSAALHIELGPLPAFIFGGVFTVTTDARWVNDMRKAKAQRAAWKLNPTTKHLPTPYNFVDPFATAAAHVFLILAIHGCHWMGWL